MCVEKPDSQKLRKGVVGVRKEGLKGVVRSVRKKGVTNKKGVGSKCKPRRVPKGVTW